MRPHQRTRRPRGLAEKQLPLRNIGLVPNLFRQQPAAVCRRFHCSQQRLCSRHISRGELVVRSFARQKRPRAPDSTPVKRSAVIVFTVSIVVIPIPKWPLGQFRFQNRVNHFDRIQDSWIVWRTQPEPNQRQCVRADHVRSALKTFARRPILNRHKAVC